MNEEKLNWKPLEVHHRGVFCCYWVVSDNWCMSLDEFGNVKEFETYEEAKKEADSLND